MTVPATPRPGAAVMVGAAPAAIVAGHGCLPKHWDVPISASADKKTSTSAFRVRRLPKRDAPTGVTLPPFDGGLLRGRQGRGAFAVLGRRNPGVRHAVGRRRTQPEIAIESRSPVRIRCAASRSRTKILPSPILPVFAAREIASII